MRNRELYNQKGFSLAEMVVAIAAFTIIGVGVIILIGSMVSTGTKQGLLLANADQARRGSFRIMQELRNAVTSNTGAYALAEASNQQIIFYSNVDGGSDVERLRYYISGGKLYRGVVKPTGSPLTYNTGSETSTVVQDNLANGANPLFYYYNGSYTGTGSALTQPVNVTQVKFVEMELRVYNKGGTTGTNYYTISSAGAIRSLKTNLGD